MVSLTEALVEERENLKHNSAENKARREVGREVLGVLFERLTQDVSAWLVLRDEE